MTLLRRLAVLTMALMFAACAGDPTDEVALTGTDDRTAGATPAEQGGGGMPTGAFDEEATMRPDLMVVEPERVHAGGDVAVRWPEGTMRGTTFVLEEQVGGTWQWRYWLGATDAIGSARPTGDLTCLPGRRQAASGWLPRVASQAQGPTGCGSLTARARGATGSAPPTPTPTSAPRSTSSEPEPIDDGCGALTPQPSWMSLHPPHCAPHGRHRRHSTVPGRHETVLNRLHA